MTDCESEVQILGRRLSEAEATISALLAGQIDAIVGASGSAPVLLGEAQEALRESEEMYRLIVETTSEGICTVDVAWRITFANRRLAEMLGHRADELLSLSISQIMADPSGAEAQKLLKSGGQSLDESDMTFRATDGSDRRVRLKTSAVRDTEGNFAGTLVMIADRTRHWHSEEDLRRSEEQYRQIVESTTDGIVKIDAAAKIMFVNRRYAAMLGYEPSELTGRSLLDLMSSAALAQSAEQFASKRRAAIDTTLRHKDGSEISVSVTANPLFDGSGKEVGYLGMARDVTERNRMQAQLMVSDRMASVGSLAAGVAHEINNPLAAVIANLDYISGSLQRATSPGDGMTTMAARETWLQEELKGPLDDAREAAERVRFIVRDLRIFSRSPAVDQCSAIDVEPIMDSSLRMAWNEIRHRARLVKDYGNVPGVLANEARLGQVFLNLVVNAAQAIPDGRAEENEIRVVTRVEGARVIIEVSDTGCGIPPEIIGRIFDAFFTTKSVGEGTGLGLAICHHIVSQAGGELTVKSTLGAGTTFRVSLPVATAEIVAVAEPVAPVMTVGRRGRIMVVDDDELMIRSVHRVLSGEHEVVSFSGAAEALAAIARGETFDLILCDLMMPDMTGMDLHRELLRVAPQMVARMIFLTGGAFTDSARIFLETTDLQRIEKPFDAPGLRAAIRRHLSQIAPRTLVSTRPVDAIGP